MISVEDRKSLLNAIKQQIFIPHLFWSRHCYYYHSLVSNSARDFYKLFKNICLCTLVSKVQYHLAPGSSGSKPTFFGLISCPFLFYSPQTVTQTLSTMGTVLYFLCLEFVFIPAFTSMSFTYSSSLSLNVTSSESSLLMTL